MVEQFNPYAAPSTIETVADSAQSAGSPMESLRGVVAGLAIICIAVILWGTYELTRLAPFILREVGRIGIPRLPRNAYRGMHLAFWLSFLLGKIRCASIPAESRARGWASTAAASNALLMVFFLPWFLGNRFEGMEKAGWLFTVLGIISTATFFLFLRQLALFIDRPDYAKRAEQLLVLYGIWEIVCYGMPHVEVWLLPWAIMPNGIAPWMHRLVFLTTGCEYILLVVILVKYFNLAPRCDRRSAEPILDDRCESSGGPRQSFLPAWSFRPTLVTLFVAFCSGVLNSDC